MDAPKIQPLEKEITNSIGMRLVLIPAGEFMMGSPAGEGEKDERPEHEVEITKPFNLGVYEVTQKQFEAVMGYNPSYYSRAGLGKEQASYTDQPAGGKDRLRPNDVPDSFPVENVRWDEANEFCERLSTRAKENDACRLYRLPHEAEWEYACRGGGGSRTRFHFGNSLSADQANLKGSRPCKVGSYEPNTFGLYDMHGNVMEWCGDWKEANYYSDSTSNSVKDPIGSSTESRIANAITN